MSYRNFDDLIRHASVETRMRDGASPKSRCSGLSSGLKLRHRRRFQSVQHSLSATASPPSLRSCADSARPAAVNLAHAIVHALFVSHIQLRRQAPELAEDHLGVLRAAEPHRMLLAQAAQQQDLAPFALERARAPGIAVFISPMMPSTGVG